MELFAASSSHCDRPSYSSDEVESKAEDGESSDTETNISHGSIHTEEAMLADEIQRENVSKIWAEYQRWDEKIPADREITDLPFVRLSQLLYQCSMQVEKLSVVNVEVNTT